MAFRKGVVPALRRFKEKRTERASTAERYAAMKELVEDLSAAYGIIAPSLSMHDISHDGDSGRSFYVQDAHAIVMVGKLSIITLLHEFAHALGKDEHGAVGWSASLFKRVYPRSYETLVHDGHTLRKPS